MDACMEPRKAMVEVGTAKTSTSSTKTTEKLKNIEVISAMLRKLHKTMTHPQPPSRAGTLRSHWAVIVERSQRRGPVTRHKYDVNWPKQIRYVVWRPLLWVSALTESKRSSIWHLCATVGIISCNDNLRCHQWRQSCHIDDLWFSVPLILITIAKSMQLIWRSGTRRFSSMGNRCLINDSIKCKSLAVPVMTTRATCNTRDLKWKRHCWVRCTHSFLRDHPGHYSRGIADISAIFQSQHHKVYNFDF